MEIWQIDPVNITPFYNIALCQALALEGQQVSYVTSKFLYDEKLYYPNTFTTDFHYFRFLENPALLHLPAMRKGLRALLYSLAHQQLISKLKQHKPDIVHFQWSRLPRFDQRLVAQIRGLGIPVVHTIHDVDPLFGQGRFTGQLKDIYEQVDALVVHTEHSRKQFLHTYKNVDPASVHIILHLALEDRLIPETASQELARQQLKIPSEAFVVMFFGGIKSYKGIDVLADAIPFVHARQPEIHFWIVGRPDADQVELLASLSDMQHVTVTASYIPSDIVWQYYLSADVLVFPYRHIFQSGALISTLGYGRAVIVTDVGGLPELVDGNGWVIPPEDPQALADAICEAAGDREQLEQMGQRSRQIVTTRNSSSRIAQQHITLYQSLIKR